jgi:hypothetical protein
MAKPTETFTPEHAKLITERHQRAWQAILEVQAMPYSEERWEAWKAADEEEKHWRARLMAVRSDDMRKSFGTDKVYATGGSFIPLTSIDDVRSVRRHQGIMAALDSTENASVVLYGVPTDEDEFERQIQTYEFTRAQTNRRAYRGKAS